MANEPIVRKVWNGGNSPILRLPNDCGISAGDYVMVTKTTAPKKEEKPKKTKKVKAKK